MGYGDYFWVDSCRHAAGSGRGHLLYFSLRSATTPFRFAKSAVPCGQQRLLGFAPLWPKSVSAKDQTLRSSCVQVEPAHGSLCIVVEHELQPFLIHIKSVLPHRAK